MNNNDQDMYSIESNKILEHDADWLYTQMESEQVMVNNRFLNLNLDWLS